MSYTNTLKLTALTLAFSCSAAAHTSSAWNGSFADGSAGLLLVDPNVSATSKVNYFGGEGGSFSLSNAQTLTQSNLSGIGELAAGYMHQIRKSRFGLGFDVFVNGASRHVSASKTRARTDSDSGTTSNVSLTTITRASLDNFEYGLDLLPGFLKSANTTVFGRIGVAFNQWHVSTNNTFRYSDTLPTNNSSTLNATKKTDVAGLRLGLGLAHHINRRLSWTANYICTLYGKPSDLNATGRQAAGTTAVANGFTNTTSASFVTHAFLAGLRYQFQQ